MDNPMKIVKLFSFLLCLVTMLFMSACDPKAENTTPKPVTVAAVICPKCGEIKGNDKCCKDALKCDK